MRSSVSVVQSLQKWLFCKEMLHTEARSPSSLKVVVDVILICAIILIKFMRDEV